MTDEMLRFTLVLPNDDGALACRLFEEAIADQGVVLFVVIGSQQEPLVRTADFRAGVYPGMRRVVWVRNPALPELQQVLGMIAEGDPALVAAALSYTDKVACRLRAGDPLDAMAIESAFFSAMSAR